MIKIEEQRQQCNPHSLKYIQVLRTYFEQPTPVAFCEETQCFRTEGRVVPGLVPKLKKVFWPNYEYTKSKYKTKKKNRGERDVYGGLTRGVIVHNQLRMYANRCSTQEFKSQYCSMHKYTEKAISALKIWNLTPIKAEFAVIDPFLNIATAADMICSDSSGKLVLIEWKTGMDSYFNRGNGTMNGPLSGQYNNCPLNQAYLQLLFTKLFLQNEHGLQISKAFVVRIGKNGVERHALPTKLIKQEARLYNHVGVCLERLAERKKLKKRNK